MKSLLTMSVGCLLLLQFTWASQEESPELAAESRDEVRELEDSFNEEVGVRLSTQPSDSVIGGRVMLVADSDSQDGERDGRDAGHEGFGERGGEFSHDEEHEHSYDGRHEHFGDEEHEHFHYETHDDFGRTAPSERRGNASDVQSLRRRLHSDFELQERRQMQQLEILRRRLETIERRIESRRRNRDRIIERRLEQALDRPRAANRHGFDFGREEEDIEIRREAERVIEENRREVERQAMSRQLRHSELLAHAEELQTQHDELDKMRAILMRRFNPGKSFNPSERELVEMSSKDPRHVFLESAIAEYEDYLSSLPERGKKHQDELADLEKRRDKRLAELRVKIVAGRPNNGTASQLQRSELFAAQMEAIQREQERIRIRKRLVDETIEQQMRSGGDLEPAQVEPTRPEGEMPPRASGRLIEDEVDPDRSPERAAL